MSDFKGLEIKPVYNSNDDIIAFYNTTLSLTRTYNRASGFFSVGLLEYVSKGIMGLYKNGGILNLVISHKVDEKTYEQIENGYNIDSLDIEEKDIEENISDLAFLISLGLVNIRIAYSKGLYHEKYGIMEDSEGNTILFSGSNNETKAAIKDNFESFETTISWNCSERDLEKINFRKREFDKLWNNKVDNLIVYDAPKALYKKILKKLDNKKSIEKIDEKTVLIDYNEKLTIFYNFNFLINKWPYFSIIHPYVETEDPDKIIFVDTLRFDDMQEITKKLCKYLALKNIKTLFSEGFKKYRNSKYLDLKSLAYKGKRIKQKDYINTHEMINFKEEINEMLLRSLREQQVVGAKHIVDIGKTFNFSVPGSGKTATVLAAFRYLQSKNVVQKLFVFGPKNSMKSWRDEILIVLGDSDVVNLSATTNSYDKETELKYTFNNNKYFIVNFEGTISAEDILSNYVDEKVMVVLDEIHRIKGTNGKTFKAIREIVRGSYYKVALTGTPLPNGYVDLKNQFEILYDDYHRTYFGFNIYNLKDKDKNFTKHKLLSHEIKEKMFPFYVRVNKKELNIPEPEPDNLVIIKENEKLTRFYQHINISKEKSLSKVFDKITVGSTPEKLIEKYHWTEDLPEMTNKLLRCIEIVDEILSRKPTQSVIIWTSYIKTLVKIYNVLSSKYSNVEKIHGTIPQEERDMIIDSFNQGKKKILINNPNTLAESVSLHRKCSNAIYLELSYNLTHYLQSRDRIHRLGIEEDRKTNYYILLSYFNDFSIDKRIYDILQKKALRMTDSIDSALKMRLLNDEIVEELSNEEIE